MDENSLQPDYEDESDSILGWTLDTVKHFMSLKDDHEKLAYCKEICGVPEEDYSYKETSTLVIDYNFGNAMFCEQLGFTVLQTQFVCATLSNLLAEAVSSLDEPHLNYDDLRVQLAESLRDVFKAHDVTKKLFSEEQVRKILCFVSVSLLKPLRLILRQFQQGPYIMQVLELRKVFAPPKPEPLREFIQERFVEPEFFAPTLGNVVTPEQAQEAIDSYIEEMKQTAAARFANLHERIRLLEQELKS